MAAQLLVRVDGLWLMVRLKDLFFVREDASEQV
jgi:hypothetical protein